MNEPPLFPPRPFATTRWSLVAAAGQSAADALADLCRLYWYPVYAYVRRQGHHADEAEDLTQAFFTDLLARGAVRAATPVRGRFRNFLLASAQHFLSHQREKAVALKRGGGRIVSLDLRGAEGRYGGEPVGDETPERLFERRWALALLERALSRLRDEQHTSGKGRQFDALKGQLTGEGTEGHAALAEELAMTPGAVKVAAHRLRQRYGELLRAEVRETVETEAEVEEEVRELFRALGSG